MANLAILPCAYFANVAAATAAFLKTCPATHTISEVRPIRHHKEPYCRWEVRYIANNGNHSGGQNAEMNFNQLALHPNNSSILDTIRCEAPPSFVIYYEVERCGCPKDFQDESTMQSSYFVQETVEEKEVFTSAALTNER